jgi:nitrite reductase/ring-hydroxylating ferredoxin subunit
MSQTAATPTSRLDPEPVARRDFLGLASLASMLGAMALAAVGMLRLPKAAVLPSASKKFAVQLPDSLPAGEPYVPPGRQVVLIRDADGVYAISLVCTHLGCIVKSVPDGFECPCHGSRFTGDGAVSKGPAPTPLPWLQVTASGGKLIVDEEVTVPPGTRVQV